MGAGPIELTEFWLLSGAARVDQGAVLSGPSPLSGSLASLKDDDVLTGVVLAAGSVLLWDFGAPGADVTDIRLGSAVDPSRFPLLCGLQYSDDGLAWTSGNFFGGIAWPGSRSKTASEQLGNLFKAMSFVAGQAGAPQAPVSPYNSVTVFDNNGVAVAAKSSGIRQFEASRTAITGGGIGIYIGVASRASIDEVRTISAASVAGRSQQITYASGGTKYVNSGAPQAYGATWGTGDVIGCTVDFSTGQVTFYKNGVSQGVAGTYLISAADCMPYLQAAGSSGSNNAAVCTLRTRGFTYPISGAEPWEDRTAIATRQVQGRIGLELQRASPSATAPSASVARPVPQLAASRYEFMTGVLGKGNGRVRGFTLDYVNPLNKPYRCRVRLVREVDGMQVREAWSDANGAYDFQFVDELQSYTVIAYYLAHGKRAVVTDGLTLANGKVELMP